MQKGFSSSRFVGLVLFLLLLSLFVIGCNDPQATVPQSNLVQPAQSTPGPQKNANIDQVVSTPTPTANAIVPTATALPLMTPTPTPPPVVTVNWNPGPSTMYTVSLANVRDMPFTSGTIVRTMQASQALTVYGTVDGEILGNGALWYRVSDQNSMPQYVYSALVVANKTAPVQPTTAPGKVIKVNLTTQHIYAYENGTVVHDNLITSGQPYLLTPTGTFQIISKLHPTTFYSPWPKTSPYYYAPLQINYALGFQGTLLFLHDAYWRGNDFGPGTNVQHTGANGTQMTGSHGCVEMPTADSAWFYNWATIGTPLIISY